MYKKSIFAFIVALFFSTISMATTPVMSNLFKAKQVKMDQKNLVVNSAQSGNDSSAPLIKIGNDAKNHNIFIKEAALGQEYIPVSYTHLTLPTICSV